MGVPDQLFHAAPLHYLPNIVQDGALYAQSVLAARDISPRATAQRRDRMLGLHDYVHLSFMAQTPLLADKMQKGFPHALLIFPAHPLLDLPQTALLPYNAKSWRTRAALTPVTDPAEQAALLRTHAATGRFPSLEALVKYGLSLTELSSIAFRDRREHDLIATTFTALALPAPAPLRVAPELFPPHPNSVPTTWEPLTAYCAACQTAGVVLPPPHLPFD